MPITSELLAERLIIAAKARRDIRRTTLALRKLGVDVINKHNASIKNDDKNNKD